MTYEQARARVGRRVTQRQIKRDRWGYRHVIGGGSPERCPGCRHWYIARVRYPSGRRSWAGGFVAAFAKRQRCNVCRDKTIAARWARSRQVRSAKRAELRRTQCTRCGATMPAARATRRYCSAACRVAAHRNANGRNRAAAERSVTVTAP